MRSHYVGNVYEYGFDQLFRMLAEAVLRAARDAGLYTAVCVPLILIAAAVFSAVLLYVSMGQMLPFGLPALPLPDLF